MKLYEQYWGHKYLGELRDELLTHILKEGINAPISLHGLARTYPSIYQNFMFSTGEALLVTHGGGHRIQLKEAEVADFLKWISEHDDSR